MNYKEILDAESKDISTYLKSNWSNKIRKGLITITTSTLLALTSFQKVYLQSNEDAIAISKKIADFETEQKSKKATPKKTIFLIGALSDKVQEQLSEHLKNEEFEAAAKDLDFYENIAKGLNELDVIELLRKLRYDLDNEKNIQKNS